MTALRKNDIVVMDDISHVLKRTSIYCGSTKEEMFDTHLYTKEGIEFKSIPIIPALIKIINEIQDNAKDEAIRTKFKYATKIEVSYDNGIITIKDNGRGLPIEYNEEYKKWTPELIYCQLRSGSNFSDDDREVSGMNGVGSAICAILSRKFSIDTCNGSKRYQQVYENSLGRINKPKITDVEKNIHYTEVTFEPNYDFFNISDEAKGYLPQIINKMCVELAYCYPEINVYYNSKKVIGKSAKQFLSSIHEIHELSETEKCRIGVFYSDTDFKQISFVNGLSTTRGGTHINYVCDAIVAYIRAYILKKYKLDVSPRDIKNKLFIFMSLRMVNSQFDNQSKEFLTNQSQDFRDTLNTVLDEKFLKSITKNEEIMFPIVEAYRLKQQVKENQDLKKITSVKKVKIEKYLPASERKKYLVLCEGDSAVGGLMPVLGRKEFSFFGLKGKPLNTLDVSKSKISDNEELKNVIQILNLRMDKDDQSQCNYENILVASDSDLDGVHIRSLLLTFFNKYAKSLIEQGRLMFLETPLVIAKQKGKIKKHFNTFTEYNKFKSDNNEKYDYFYKKGLGSLKRDELKELFDTHGLNNFIKTFELDDSSDESIRNWMSKSTVDKRKENLRDKSFDINGA